MITFVIPSYNSVAWLPSAVSSCLGQKYKDIQIVIVDDGSTDMTWHYLKNLEAIKDTRIKIIRSENKGRSHARNLGNQAADGKVICVLDADDLALENRAGISARMVDEQTPFFYGSAQQMTSDGTYVGQQYDLIACSFSREKVLNNPDNPLKETKIVHSTVAYLKEIAVKYPYRDGEISELGIDDWDMQMRLSADGVKFAHTPEFLSVYRNFSSGITKKRDEKKVLDLKERLLAVAA